MKGGKKVVLHVEDEETIQALLKAYWKRNEDIVILQAKSNEEAWSIFIKNFLNVDKIIVDGTLTDGPSLELIKKIRTFGFVGKISANSGCDEKEAQKMLGAGCDKFYPKPTNPKDILEMIK